MVMKRRVCWRRKAHSRRIRVKGSHWFLKGLFKGVMPKQLGEKTALFWGLCMYSREWGSCSNRRVYEASQCCVILTQPRSLYELHCWVTCVRHARMCFDVNRNLSLHFLIISWSSNNLAFSTSRIVDISVWVCVFVILVSVCRCVLIWWRPLGRLNRGVFNVIDTHVSKHISLQDFMVCFCMSECECNAFCCCWQVKLLTPVPV